MVGKMRRLDFFRQCMSIPFELFAASGSIATLFLPSSKLLRLGDIAIERDLLEISSSTETGFCCFFL